MGTISCSSLVKAAGFEGGPGDKATLRVKFPDATIDFYKVPYSVFSGLVKSRDPAQFYLKNVYGQYDYKKLNNS